MSLGVEMASEGECVDVCVWGVPAGMWVGTVREGSGKAAVYGNGRVPPPLTLSRHSREIAKI